MVMVTVELAEPLEDVRLLVTDVMVDPHPPAWVEVGDGGCQVMEELGVPRSRAVTGSTV